MTATLTACEAGQRWHSAMKLRRTLEMPGALLHTTMEVPNSRFLLSMMVVELRYDVEPSQKIGPALDTSTPLQQPWKQPPTLSCHRSADTEVP